MKKKDLILKVLFILSILSVVISAGYYFMKYNKNIDLENVVGKVIPDFEIRNDKKIITRIHNRFIAKSANLALFIKNQTCSSCMENIKEPYSFYTKYSTKSVLEKKVLDRMNFPIKQGNLIL
jgi:hypothetical protein